MNGNGCNSNCNPNNCSNCCNGCNSVGYCQNCKAAKCRDSFSAEICRDIKCNIMKSESKVAECEADLFCEISERLSCEIKNARCLCQVEHITDMASRLLMASAAKEKAMSEVIEACSKKKEKKRDFCDEYLKCNK